MKKICTIICSLLVLASSLHAQSGDKAYLFSYFADEGAGLLLCYSYDGLDWKDLSGGKPIMKPVLGPDRLMRDPSICKGPDGLFHMVWTTGWHDRIIGHASSPDLIHWSPQQTIPVMMHEPDAKNSWAPEITYDKKSRKYFIYWATTIPGRHSEVASSQQEQGLNHRIYCVTTRDFKEFSPTEIWFNPDFSVIDAAVVKDAKSRDFIMFLKNENPNPPEKNIRITRSRSMKKGFPTDVSAPITGDYWAEGPSPIFIGDALYVYFDKYTQHKYGAVRSLDRGRTWEDISDSVHFPKGTRHGTAFEVEREVLDNLLAYYSSSNASACKSLGIKEICIDAGAEKPFSILQVSDSHLSLADSRDTERKNKLASQRSSYWPNATYFWQEAVDYAKENNLLLVHTGDLEDFVSEANLDTISGTLKSVDAICCPGNHEFSQYVGEAREDEAYKAESMDKVQSAFTNPIGGVYSRVINGVNFVAVDDVYYYITETQSTLVRKEFEKGLPVILLCHVPLFTEDLCEHSLKAEKGICAYVTGAPLEITSKFQNDPSLPEDLQWKNRSVQQRADKTTLDFVAWLKEQPLLKGILCGHLHNFYEGPFSPTANQYVCGAGYAGQAQIVRIK